MKLITAIGERDLVARTCLLLDRHWSTRWPLRRGKGLFRRIVNVCARLGLAPAGWREYNGVTIWLDPTNYMSRCLLDSGTYQPEVAHAIVGNLPPGGTFVDVGANFGYMTMLAARQAGSTGRVFAVEPCPEIADLLREHLKRNDLRNVTVIQAGCSNQATSLPLYVAAASNPGKTSLSSDNAQSRRSVPVEVAPLDCLLLKYNPGRVDVLKIDVEGAELQVLQGAMETLKHFRPVIVAEIDSRLLASFGTTPEDIFRLLGDLGYEHEPLSEHDIIARPLPLPVARQFHPKGLIL